MHRFSPPAWEELGAQSTNIFFDRMRRTRPSGGPMESIAPHPWILVDLDPLWVEPEGVPDHVSNEIERLALRSFRLCTEPDEWIYAWDEIRGRLYHFWPHRQSEPLATELLPVSFFPNGDDQVFLSQNFEWGTHAMFIPPASKWQLLVFGERLLDAFSGKWPVGWSAVIRRSV